MYYIVKFVTKIIFRLYYRKIYVDGLEFIPKDKPVLLCSNHPNGFVEPVVIGTLLKDGIYFLVRGDLFDKPVLGWFLRNSHQIPIYRRKDGFKNLKSNASTLEWVNNALKDHKKILIFPEGGTEPFKFLRPLHKGVARMAFDFQTSYPEEDLKILPISINFTQFFKMRSEIMVRFSPPISVQEYVEDFEINKARTYRSLLEDLRVRIESHVISLPEEDDLSLYEKLVPLIRGSFYQLSFSVVLNDKEQLKNEVDLANKIKASSDKKKLAWNSSIDKIISERNRLGIKRENYYLKKSSIFDYVILFFGFIPAILGYLIHWIPAKLSLFFANKYAKDDVFWTSLIVSGSFGIYPIYYMFLLIPLSIYFAWKSVFILPIIMFFGWSYFHVVDLYHSMVDSYKWNNSVSSKDLEEDIAILNKDLMS